jgi:N-carbamoyl-L-amino-acid hydrolase
MSDGIGNQLLSSAQRVIGDLRELAALTSSPEGAQRVAWGPVWAQAREWLRQKVAPLGLTPVPDAAGNNWITLPGESSRTVIVGGHLDSVPNGGWLDGTLGVLVALEALRRYAQRSKPPVTLRLVDWADEEGARFGRSLLGSSAAAGRLKVDEVRELRDADGTRLEDALRDHGVSLDTMLNARGELARIDARAYLEMHIEQGPVLESLNRSAGVVLGTFGLERNMVRFVGQAAHSGSTPIAMRRDAFLAAAATALECREIARRHSKPGAGVVCTVGLVRVEPGIVTAVPASRRSRSISARSTPMCLRSWSARHRMRRGVLPTRIACQWNGGRCFESSRVPSIHTCSVCAKSRFAK